MTAGTLYAGYAPAGQLLALPSSGRAVGAPAGLRVGGAVRGHRERRGHAVAVRVALVPLGVAARGGWPGWSWRSAVVGRRVRAGPQARASDDAGPSMSREHRRSERRGWSSLVVARRRRGGGRRPRADAGVGQPAGRTRLAGQRARRRESSAWYCTGQTHGSGRGTRLRLLLTNTTGECRRRHRVRREPTPDPCENAAVAVPAPVRRWSRPLPAPSSGSWVSASVTVAGGGWPSARWWRRPSGWSVSPCQSTTSAAGSSPAGPPPSRTGCTCPCSTRRRRPSSSTSASSPRPATVHPINDQGDRARNPTRCGRRERRRRGPEPVRTVSTVVDGPDGPHRGRRGPGVRRSPRRGCPSWRERHAPQSHWFIPQSEETGGRDLGDRRLQPGTGARIGHGAPATAVGPAGPAHRTGRPGHDLGPGDERADPDPRRRRLLDRRSSPRAAPVSWSGGPWWRPRRPRRPRPAWPAPSTG